ncbi:MAG: tyrosine-protein phosphatase [Bacilli bacterium]|jgi:protein-tyrosine phosphatase
MFLKFATIDNIRDLGGVTTADGRTVVFKRLLRSSDLHRLSQSELSVLKKEYNLKVVIDFRSTKSTVSRKDRLDQTIKYYHKYTLAFLEENSLTRETKMDTDEFFLKVYRSLALCDEAIEAYRRFFRIVIENEEGAILWHCTSGKDRTGIAAALLLKVLGCDMNTIYQEHFRTNEVTLPILAAKLKEVNPGDHELIKYYRAFYTAKKEYIDAYFSAVLEKCDTVDEYIAKELNVSGQEKEVLRTRYLQK